MNTKKLLLLFSFLVGLLAVQAQFNNTYQYSGFFKFSVPRPGTKAIHSTTSIFPNINQTTASVLQVDSSTSGALTKRILFHKTDGAGNTLCSKTFHFISNPNIRVNALTRTNDGGYLIIGQGSYFESSTTKTGILVVRINGNCDVVYSRIYEIATAGLTSQNGEGFTINKTNELTEQYIISGFYQLFDASHFIQVLKIKVDGSIVWFKKLNLGFGLSDTDPYVTFYRSDLNRLIIFGIGTPSSGNKRRITCTQVDQATGSVAGSTKIIRFEGITNIDALNVAFSTKTNRYYIAFAGTGDSVGLNNTGLFVTQLSAQFNPISTRQYLVKAVNKLIPTGIFIKNNGTTGQSDSIDVAAEETRAAAVKSSLLTVRSDGAIIAYNRFMSSSSDVENISTSSLFVSNGNYFINGVETSNPARTKLIRFLNNSTLNNCVNSITAVTNRLFIAISTQSSPITNDLGLNNGIITMNASTGSFRSNKTACITANPQGVPNHSQLKSENFTLFPTLFYKGQTSFAVKAVKEVKVNCQLTITDAMGVTRLQKTLQPDTKQWQLQLPNLPTGLYYVNIRTAKEQLYKTTIVVE